MLRIENKNNRYFDAKLRFALLASLRLAILSETEVNNLLVTFTAKVNMIIEQKLFSDIPYFFRNLFLDINFKFCKF